MRPRIFASATLSAALSAALGLAAEPPASLPAIPAIQVPDAKPVAPTQLPAVKPLTRTAQEKPPEPPKPLPGIPAPRNPGDPAPMGSDAPPKFATEAPAVPAAVAHSMPVDTKIHDDHLGPWNTVWVRGGYHYLWIREAAPSIPLATTNGNTVLGGTATDFGGFSAFSIEGGMWLNERHTWGISASGFLAEQRSTVASATSDTALTRPFFNPQLGGPNGSDAFIVSAPNTFTGSIAYEQGARIAGFDLNGVFNVVNNEKLTLNASAGFRYFDLDEYATVYQSTQSVGAASIPFFGQTQVVNMQTVPLFANGVLITDRIRTRNQFYGGQLGGDLEYRMGPIFLDFGVKAALGPVHQVTEVEGRTDGSNGGSGPGGFLAVGTPPNGNQARISTDRFAVLADLNGLLGVQITSKLRAGVGYQFMYLTDVARPSSQFVSSIDPRSVPTTTGFGNRAPSNTALGGRGTPPNVPYDRSDFYMHGLRFLVEVQY